MFNNVKADYKRYALATCRNNKLAQLFFVLLELSYWAVLIYRFGRFANTIKIPLISHLAKIIYLFAKLISEIMSGIQLSVNSDIGPGFHIGHFSCVIVTAETIGENCSIGQGVTIGSKGAGKSDGWPTLGNNVYVGAGAKIIGNISLGDNVVVGANAVVTQNVPENCTAVGIPAKIISKD